ncbi:MAG: hypothetical protein K0S33_975 [Bacteroidetes bacterium]|jgi:hypothetical protein|nr:hypothetical protein [Bacteroidota bacterium]
MKKSFVIFLHAGYWLLYLFLLTFFLLGMNMATGGHPATFKSLGLALFCSPVGIASIVPGLIGFYGFYSLLFDKYLSRKKFLMLFIHAVLVCILSAVVSELLMAVIFRGPRSHINWSFGTCITMGLFLGFIALINGIIGLVMKGFITWYKDITLKAELDKKNYDMEVALIKAQINPHFLFNTINNIDVLIKKDADKASEYLNTLSDILRFTLYDTKADKIELSKELSYIEKFIGLQKIRSSNPDYIRFITRGTAGAALIEPMLLIPFIENAFKHAENKKTENAINILIEIEIDRIRFVCENQYTPNGQLKPEHSGLGNSLIKRRLELLYPGKHSLAVSDAQGLYKINLVLSLDK